MEVPVAYNLHPFPFPASSSSELTGTKVSRIQLNPSFPPSARRRRSRGAAIRASRKDYYSALNVGRNATSQEIKSSYRKLARKVRYNML